VFGAGKLREDITGDGVVNMIDLAGLVSHWLALDCAAPDWCQGADMNQNGTVNFVILLCWLENGLMCQ